MNTATSSLDISVEQPGGLERRVTIKVPQADIDRQIDERLRKVGRTARLKGFRPGKVPAKVVRQQYGAQVHQEVLADLVRSSYSQAVEQEQLNPAGSPHIEMLEAGEADQFAFCATFDVFPEINLKPLTDLNIERPVMEITEANLDAMVEKLRDQRASWVTVDREAGEGDRVTVDFVGRVDGAEFDGGKGDGVQVIVGGGQVVEDFDRALVGLAAGKAKTADVRFPDDYPSESLAGKTAVFEIATSAVEEKHLPALDEAFAKEFAVADGSIEGLRTEVRRNMQREANERLKKEARRRVFDAVIHANEILLPRGLVHEEVHGMRDGMAQRLGVKDGKNLPNDEYFEPMAKERVALGLLLRELIKQNGIEPDRARAHARIDELAAPYENPEEVAQLYRGSRELMSQIESGVLEDQVVEFILEQAQTVEKSITFDELMRD